MRFHDNPFDESGNKKYCFAVILPVFGGLAENLYWVDMAAPLANDRAKAVRFGFALVSCHVEDYDV